MKKRPYLWQIIGFIFTISLGTVLHFLYEWLENSIWISPFSSVNESTWEHLKLLFWPMFIFAIVQYFFFKNFKNYWCVKLRGIVFGLFLIPIIFYTYNGVIGKSPDWLNIAIFIITVAIVFLYENRLFIANALRCKSPKLSLIILVIIAFCFVVFTFKTPMLKIFKDPLTGGYGK